MGSARAILAFLLILAAPCYAPSEVDTFWRKTQKGKTLADRIDRASLSLLGIPFLDAPLGEGPGAQYDQGPIFRFDGFDCTTFVETVLALATSRKAEEFESRLRHIRYRGDTFTFTERNHFPDIDWIPHNTRSGLLTDVTAKIAEPWGVLPATGVVNKKGWYAHLPLTAIRVEGLTEEQKIARLAQLHREGANLGQTVPALSYIPLDKIIRRKTISEEERLRRLKEEDQIALEVRERVRQPQSDDLDKEVHDTLVDKRLRYLLEDAEVDPAFLAAVPHAAVLNVVRPGWKIPGTALNISHQGLVIRKKEGVYFRHVSKSGGRAKDVPLANYLRLCLLLPAIKGVNLLVANESNAL